MILAAFDGPNIYVRCLCALKSGLPAEQDYALHHLVKISMERGDKYRFESFPGLVEALIEKVLGIGRFFYMVNWQVSYGNQGTSSDPGLLDGLHGTPDLLKRIGELTKLDYDGNLQEPTTAASMLQINEAALTIRNMIMLEDNAQYVSDLPAMKDLLTILLNLPSHEDLVELKHYALDIAEQLTRYLSLSSTDPLYLSLLAQLYSEDRGAILTSLRAICRISMNLEETNHLHNVSLRMLENILNWLMLEDEDLTHACLDFLYQYTAVVENVELLLSRLHLEPFVVQLARLLSHGVKSYEREFPLGRDHRRKAPANPAETPDDLLEQLLRFDEPERSARWLRCLFEEDRDESVTQIVLWTLYQQVFARAGMEGRSSMQAADYIKNVSNTFPNKASAQVQAGPVQRFIVQGIRPRDVPVDLNGKEYSVCKWRADNSSHACNFLFMSAETGYKHVLTAHLSAQQREDGKFIEHSHGVLTCCWDSCMRYRTAPAPHLSQLASHIKTHLPMPSPTRSLQEDASTKNPKLSYIVPAKTQTFLFQKSPVDEQQHLTGMPLTAVLILRNLARNIPKTNIDENIVKSGGVSWVHRLMKPIEPHLQEIFAHNVALVSGPYTCRMFMTDNSSAPPHVGPPGNNKRRLEQVTEDCSNIV